LISETAVNFFKERGKIKIVCWLLSCID
jgi:hypothetical protein